ncbi:lysophospholipase-like protein 1 isoform X2 [Takifugu rubripes]|uniref:palmitoyl-protein hydrolase n=1 Tax=Takifugu rubripes TaxID=31033 RepID=A0A674NF37_TAKRU|nr:lysophospholipase-like protein 1 isoform X2 [Takifugu rubripes]|eukprot:XP_003965792.1 PREDICTED: lysophospholipase-like protein 1 [Takifugu rubripes]
MAAVRRLQLCAVSPAGTHSASVIFLHGSGDTGQGLRSWVRDILTPDLAFSHIRVIYPTAPVRPYTPMRGALSTVWFDRYKISRDCPEHLESIDTMCSSLGAVIQEEVKAGIPTHRIIIGGFSMGGAMALHLACRYHPDVAGVFALSSFLNKDSAAFQATEDRFHRGLPLPELFQCHGSTDELVLPAWGEETSALLRKAGMSTLFYSFPGLSHQLSPPGMEMLRSWILQKLPPAGPS